MGRLDPYLELLTDFVERDALDAVTFQDRYLDLFGADQTAFPDDEFLVLDKVFADADMFEADPEIRGTDYIDEAALRAGATDALTRMRALEGRT